VNGYPVIWFYFSFDFAKTPDGKFLTPFKLFFLRGNGLNWD